MVFKICLLVSFVFVISPLLVLSQNNSPGGDFESLAKKKAHHRKTGFFNPWLTENQPGGVWRFLRWKLGSNPYAAKKKKPIQFPSIPTNVKKIQSHGDSITYLGHATLWIRLKGQNIITDPVFGDIVFFVKRHAPFPIPLEELPDFQVVLISHGHFDHLNEDSIGRLGTAPLYLTPLGYKDWFESVVPGARVVELDWFDTYTFQGITYRLLPAQHWTKRSLFDTNQRLWGSWLVEGGGRKVFFAGDSGYFSGYREFGKKFGPLDAALMPVGLYEPRWFMQPYQWIPREAIKATLEMRAEVLIPQQWGVFDLTDQPMDLPPRDYREAAGAAGLNEQSTPLVEHGGTRYFPDQNNR